MKFLERTNKLMKDYPEETGLIKRHTITQVFETLLNNEKIKDFNKDEIAGLFKTLYIKAHLEEREYAMGIEKSRGCDNGNA
ncbi:MAG: hypothetical protein V3V61_01100 [Gammaproteobacteria bacterium]